MKKNQAMLILISIFIVSAALGVGGTWGVKKIGAKSSVDDGGLVAVTGGGGGGSISPDNPVEPTPTPTPTPEDITLVSVTGPTPNPETRTYSFTATASGGWGQYTYYLYPARNARDTLVSTSGSFSSVKPNGNGYILLVRDQYRNEFTQKIGQFKTIYKKYTTEELTKLLSTDSPNRSLAKQFVSGCELKFDGIPQGQPTPTGHLQINSNIAAGYWQRVKVTQVEYNEYNQIISIRMNVYFN